MPSNRRTHLYTLITRGPQSTEVEVIGSIVDFIHASPRADRLVASIADPATQIVSLTITEGGYPVDDSTGDYLAASPTAGPASAFGILAAGLQQRYQNGHSGLTVISCDNILSNGSVARTATLGEAHRLGDGLADWIADSVAFPNSMVDRITPATTDSDRAWLAAHKGINDNWPVVAESFRQWVIEDSFAAGRPPFEQLDVLTTTDAKPYELMKLRLLNAGHSCLAYLAALTGTETIDAALAHPELYDFTVDFLAREARPVFAAHCGDRSRPVHGVDHRSVLQHQHRRPDQPSLPRRVGQVPQVPAANGQSPARGRRTHRSQHIGIGRLVRVPHRATGALGGRSHA